MIFQWPFLSDPSRFKYPFSCKSFKYLSAVLLLFLMLLDILSAFIVGSNRINSRMLFQDCRHLHRHLRRHLHRQCAKVRGKQPFFLGIVISWQRLILICIFHYCHIQKFCSCKYKKGTPITQDAIQEPSLGTHLRYGNLRVVHLQSVLVEHNGIEPSTSSLRTRRSPIWANVPASPYYNFLKGKWKSLFYFRLSLPSSSR